MEAGDWAHLLNAATDLVIGSTSEIHPEAPAIRRPSCIRMSSDSLRQSHTNTKPYNTRLRSYNEIMVRRRWEAKAKPIGTSKSAVESERVGPDEPIVANALRSPLFRAADPRHRRLIIINCCFSAGSSLMVVAFVVVVALGWPGKSTTRRGLRM